MKTIPDTAVSNCQDGSLQADLILVKDELGSLQRTTDEMDKNELKMTEKKKKEKTNK